MGLKMYNAFQKMNKSLKKIIGLTRLHNIIIYFYYNNQWSLTIHCKYVHKYILVNAYKKCLG